MSDYDELKTPAEYRDIAQLTKKGISSDYMNYISYRVQFDAIQMLRQVGKMDKMTKLFQTIKKGMMETPTYSEKYLNNKELQQAAEYGVKREDLINSATEPAIRRLDEIALRLRQIGSEITEDTYQNFVGESEGLYLEARSLI